MGNFNTLSDLKEFIDHIEKTRPRELDKSLEIAVVSQGSMGGSPTVKIKNMVCGIDWDAGKLIIYPEDPLIKLTPEDLEVVRKSVSQAHSYHTGLIVMPLIKENKELKSFIESLDPNLLTDEQKVQLENIKNTKRKK